MRLILYGTNPCQLCGEAEDLIYRALEGQEYDLIKVDIRKSDELMKKYALSIPVLSIESNNQARLKWPFSEVDVLAFLREQA